MFSHSGWGTIFISYWYIKGRHRIEGGNVPHIFCLWIPFIYQFLGKAAYYQ